MKEVSKHIDRMAAPTNLQVAFWNVECLPKAISEDKMYYSDERAKLVVPHIQGYDVVLMCEVWTLDARKVFSKVFPYSYTDVLPSGKIYGDGLYIISKYPLVQSKILTYSTEADWDWFSAKGVLFVQIDVNNQLYDFYVTQMQATYANYSQASQTARLYQSLELLNFVNTNSGTNPNVFVTGDFNMRPFVPMNNSTTQNDRDDWTIRAACYEMIKARTGTRDLQTSNSMYRMLTRMPANQILSFSNLSIQPPSAGSSYILVNFKV